MLNSSNLKRYSKMLGKGLLHEVSPGIVAGVINELFHEWNVDVAKVTDYVQYHRSLWDQISPEYQNALKNSARLIDPSFLTPDFIVNAINKDFPAVASLFLSWTAAGEWLAGQTEQLKNHISGQTTE
jgi:hypothetical protein